jgi:hypothetical protein
MTRTVSLLAAAMLVPVLAGCGSTEVRAVDPDGPAPSTSTAEPNEPITIPEGEEMDRIAMSAVEIVRVESSGGMCASGVDGEGREGSVCTSTLVVNGDGSWTAIEADTTQTGTLTTPEMGELVGLLYDSDADDNPKAETSCESWVDGRDVTVTYTPADGAREGDRVSLSSCDYDFSGSRLMSLLSTIGA